MFYAGFAPGFAKIPHDLPLIFPGKRIDKGFYLCYFLLDKSEDEDTRPGKEPQRGIRKLRGS